MKVIINEINDIGKLDEFFGPDSKGAHSLSDFCHKYTKQVTTLDIAPSLIPGQEDTVCVTVNDRGNLRELEFGVLFRIFTFDGDSSEVTLVVVELTKSGATKTILA